MNLKILILTLFTFSIQRKHALKKKSRKLRIFNITLGACVAKNICFVPNTVEDTDDKD